MKRRFNFFLVLWDGVPATVGLEDGQWRLWRGALVDPWDDQRKITFGGTVVSLAVARVAVHNTYRLFAPDPGTFQISRVEVP